MDFDSSTLDPSFSTLPTIDVASYRLADNDNMIPLSSDYNILKVIGKVWKERVLMAKIDFFSFYV